MVRNAPRDPGSGARVARGGSAPFAATREVVEEVNDAFQRILRLARVPEEEGEILSALRAPAFGHGGHSPFAVAMQNNEVMWAVPIGFLNDGGNYFAHPEYADARTGANRMALIVDEIFPLLKIFEQGRGFFQFGLAVLMYNTNSSAEQKRRAGFNEVPYNDPTVNFPDITRFVELPQRNIVGYRSMQSAWQELERKLETEFSGVEDYGSRDGWVFVNIFVKLTRRSGFGGHLNESAPRELLSRSKLIWNPPEGDTDCFWQCLTLFKQPNLKRAKIRLRETARALRGRTRGSQSRDPVSYDELVQVSILEKLNIQIFNLQREQIFETTAPGATRTMLLVLSGTHFMLAKNLNFCFMTHKCSLCQRGFETAEEAQDHEEAGECLKCKFCGDYIPSLSGKQSHERNCVAAENATRYVKFKEKKEQLCERWYGTYDLETFVQEGTSAQCPYAVGWSMVVGPSAGVFQHSYGTECMEEFFIWLDRLCELFEEEVYNRSSNYVNGTLDDPTITPFEKRKMRRAMNSFWNKLIKGKTELECKQCGDVIQASNWKKHKNTHEECLRNSYISAIHWSELQKNQRGLAPTTKLFAHNGAKFDAVFVARHAMETGRFAQLKILKRKGLYMRILYRDRVEFNCTICMGLLGSLDGLARSYNLEMTKDHFPHSYLDSWDKVFSTDAQDLHRTHFDMAGSFTGPMTLSYKRSMTEEEFALMMEEHGGVYNIRERCVEYLEKDVQILAQLVQIAAQGWAEMPNSPDFFECFTVSQLTQLYYFRHYCPENSYVILEKWEENWIMRDMVGARTEVFQRSASKGETPEEQINYVDVNSLYPGVMEQHMYPGGHSTWHTLQDSEVDLNYEQVTPCDTDIVYYPTTSELTEFVLENWDECFGYVEVDVRVPQDLHIPPIGIRTKIKGVPKLLFTCWNLERRRVFTEELRYAVDHCGYEIERVYTYWEFEKRDLFSEMIGVLKDVKIEASRTGNKALRSAAKLAMNSLYGKTMQTNDSSTALTSNSSTVLETLADTRFEHTLTPVYVDEHGQNSVVEIKSVQMEDCDKKNPKSSAVVGVAILAHGKMTLHEYMRGVMGRGGTVLYCDTDSIVYQGETLPDSDIHDDEFGKMKEEIPPERILEFVAVAPKVYALRCDHGNYIRCKGVAAGQNVHWAEEIRSSGEDWFVEEEETGDLYARGVSFENFKRLIHGKSSGIQTNQVIFERTIEGIVNKKYQGRTLRDNFDKRFVFEDGTTRPWRNGEGATDILNHVSDRKAGRIPF